MTVTWIWLTEGASWIPENPPKMANVASGTNFASHCRPGRDWLS